MEQKLPQNNKQYIKALDSAITITWLISPVPSAFILSRGCCNLYQYLCKSSTFCFKPEFLRVQPHWFTLYQWRRTKQLTCDAFDVFVLAHDNTNTDSVNTKVALTVIYFQKQDQKWSAKLMCLVFVPFLLKGPVIHHLYPNHIKRACDTSSSFQSYQKGLWYIVFIPIVSKGPVIHHLYSKHIKRACDTSSLFQLYQMGLWYTVFIPILAKGPVIHCLYSNPSQKACDTLSFCLSSPLSRQ